MICYFVMMMMMMIGYGWSALLMKQTVYSTLKCNTNYTTLVFNYSNIDITHLNKNTQITMVAQLTILSKNHLPLAITQSPLQLQNPQNLTNLDTIAIMLHNHHQQITKNLTSEELLKSNEMYVGWLDVAGLPYVGNNDLAIGFEEGRVVCAGDVNFGVAVALYDGQGWREGVQCVNGEVDGNQCVCDRGYYGADCSLFMEKMGSLSDRTIGMLPKNIHKHLIIQLPPSQLLHETTYSKIQLQITSQKPNQVITMWHKHPKNTPILTPTNIFNQQNPLNINNIDFDPQNQIILVTIYAIQSGIVEAGLSRRYTDQEKVVLIVVAVSLVGGIILLLGGLFYCVYCKNLFGRNWSNNAVAATPIRILPSRKNNKIENYHLDINQHFPQIPYSKFIQQVIPPSNQPIQNRLPNTTCAICLDSFPLNPHKTLRYTYCNHLFHSNCLEQWKNRQSNCPLCRQEFLLPRAQHWQQKLSKIQQNVPEQPSQKYKAIYLLHMHPKYPQNNCQLTSSNLINKNSP